MLYCHAAFLISSYEASYNAVLFYQHLRSPSTVYTMHGPP